MFNIGWQELVIIAVIVLIVFGPGKLPDIGAKMGKAVRSFNDAKNFDILDDEEKPKKSKKKDEA